MELHQLPDELGHGGGITAAEPIIKAKVAALNPADVAETIPEGCDQPLLLGIAFGE